MARLQPPRRRTVINGLRLFWLLITLWFEYAIFLYSAGNCAWPDSPLFDIASTTSPTHILFVADPQILNLHSYPDRPAWLTYITQVLVDLNLKKSWRAALRSAPDVCFILGDMMDEGRADMSEADYEHYVQRFLNLFSADTKTPVYFIPGNHDVGLGPSTPFSPQARARYTSYFGPLNSHLSIANYTFVMIDAPGLVDEDYKRHGRRKSYADWSPIPGGTIDFVKNFAAEGSTEPTILLSHIPLSRPEGSSCGPLRERGTIRRGVGFGYQNTLGRDSSRFLLEHLRPALIFSGDDHDYCDYTHMLDEPSSSSRIREVTIKSLSIAMGIKRPGYHMLSIVPPGGPKFTHSDAPCLMPDQLRIYLNVYIPLALISLVVLLISCIIHGQYYLRWSFQPSLSGQKSKPSTRKRSGGSRIMMDEYGYTLDSDTDEKLPPPVSARFPPKQGSLRSLFSSGRGRRIPLLELFQSIGRAMFLSKKRGGLFSEFLFDVRDVAVFPLGIIFLISFWALMVG